MKHQPDEKTKPEVRVDADTVWLTQQQMGQLFGTNRQAITKHLKNIYDSEELVRESTSFQQPSELVIPTGCVWDAYSYLSDLVRTAKERVILIDNFIDDRTLLLLDKRAVGVEATVYTRYSEKTELDLAKHNSQYEPVQRVQLPHSGRSHTSALNA